MKFRKTLLYVLLLCFVCFQNSTWLLHAQEEDTQTQTTLYAKDAQGNNIGSVQGKFTQGTQLVMENNPSKLGYGEISRSYLRDAQEVFTYGVTLENGTYDGEIEFTFFIGDEYNGKTANIVTRRGEDWGYVTYVQVIEDGMVKLKIAHTSYAEQIPVLFGIYDTDGIFEDTTLSETIGGTKVQIQGTFTTDASVRVVMLLPQAEAYQKMKEAVENQTIINAFTIRLNGECSGIVTYQVPITLPDNKEPVNVLFLKSNGKVETIYDTKVEDGLFSFSTNEIGSFMIIQEQSTQKTSELIVFLQTYPWQIGIGGIVLLILVIALFRHH